MEIIVGVSIIIIYLFIRNCTDKIANDCRWAPQFNNLHHSSNKFPLISYSGGLGLLPYKRLMGMFCWMGSHFYGWIDYKGFAFSIELLEWGCICADFFG